MAAERAERLKRALVVDDDPAMCEALAERLASMSVEVYEAPDGHQGFTLALRVLPDVIISDEAMPHLTGTELLALVRADPVLCHVGFVLLAASTNPERLKRPLRPGANEYLPKPFAMDDFVLRVQRALTPPPSTTRSVMKGDLKFFSLPDVLIMTHQNRQTGLLRVEEDASGQSFTFLFIEGSLVWALASGGVLGLKAFNRSLRVTQGHFGFTPWASFRRQPWHADYNVNDVLLGGIQEVDEMPLMFNALPGAGKRLVLAEGVEAAAFGDETVAAPLLEGRLKEASVQELLDLSAEADLDAAKALKALIDKKLLRVV